MARRNSEPQEPTADIRIDVQEGPGFADVPRPEMTPNETARALAGGLEVVGPVALPEEAQAVRQQPAVGPRKRRPIADIIDTFLADIQNHPDAHMLTSALNGPADESESQCFPDAPVRSLRVDRIAVIRRTTNEQVAVVSQSSERKRWQEQVIAGHVADMREQQEAMAANRKRESKPAVDPEQIAAITAAVVAAMKAQQQPAAATA